MPLATPHTLPGPMEDNTTAAVIPKRCVCCYLRSLPAVQEVGGTRDFIPISRMRKRGLRQMETFLGEQSPGLSALWATILEETPSHHLGVSFRDWGGDAQQDSLLPDCETLSLVGGL